MSNPLVGWILVLGGSGAAFVAIRAGAKRFAARKEREGTWGPDGPLEPTDPPPGWRPGRIEYSRAAVNEADAQHFVEYERARQERREERRARQQQSGAHKAQRPTIALRLSRNQQLVGKVTREDVDLLIEELEVDAARPSQCFIEEVTITELEKAGASHGLLAVLRSAVGSSAGEDIEWAES